MVVLNLQLLPQEGNERCPRRKTETAEEVKGFGTINLPKDISFIHQFLSPHTKKSRTRNHPVLHLYRKTRLRTRPSSAAGLK